MKDAMGGMQWRSVFDAAEKNNPLEGLTEQQDDLFYGLLYRTSTLEMSVSSFAMCDFPGLSMPPGRSALFYSCTKNRLIN
jgi:hypothetical protein